MRAALLLIALLLPGVSWAQGGDAPPIETDINFFLGQKQLEQDDWGSLSQQLEIGVESAWSQRRWPVAIAADLLYSAEQRDRRSQTQGLITRSGNTLELDLGLRRYLRFGIVRPFVGAGGGFAMVQVNEESAFFTEQQNGSAFGWWAGGGVALRLGRTGNVGFSVRWSDYRVRSNDFPGSVAGGGLHVGILVGFGTGDSVAPAP